MSAPTDACCRREVLWTPPADARRALRARPLPRRGSRSERGPRLRRVRRALALVGLRPRGVLVVGLGVLRGPFARAVRARARLARDARRRVVPRRAPELRRAHGRPRRGSRRGRGRRVLADARARRADVRRPPRAGRACPRRAAAPRGRPGRPCRRVPPEHPGDARRLPRDREPRRDLGDVPARVRRAQRPRPARPARAEGAARGRRVPLRRQARRPARAGRGDPRGAAGRRDSRARPVRRRRGRRAPGRRLLGRRSSPSRRSSRSTRCRSPIRSTCSSRRARPGCRRRSSTATAASCSST